MYKRKILCERKLYERHFYEMKMLLIQEFECSTIEFYKEAQKMN